MAALGAPALAAASGDANAQRSLAPAPTSVLLAFLPAGGAPTPEPVGRRPSASQALEAELARVNGLSIGIMSAAQGTFTTAQLALDITQGARIASSAYASARPPALSLQARGGGAFVEGWAAVVKRAENAPQLLRPGLLGAQIPGGGAYAGISPLEDIDGVVAADRHGRVAIISLGPARTLLARIAALQRRKRFVVSDLPGGAEGYSDLRAISAARSPAELLMVVQRGPDTSAGQLLWAAAAGLAGGGGRELSSQTTEERGLIASVDLAPTILGHLRLTVPADMRGDPIHTEGRLRSASLSALMARLRVIGPRRLTALACLLGAWTLLLLASALWPGRGAARRTWAMRVGALGVLWAPVAVLLPAAIEPGAALEYLIITFACIALGAITDLLLPWPRAPLVPAIVAVLAVLADAVARTQLLMRSLLGPDPILGARFYGIGNELKSALAVLVFAAVAAALYPLSRAHARRGAITIATAGALLAVVEGSARLGAGVGGVVLVSAGTAVATALLLPGRVTRRRALLVLISPIVALVALAALDLATAHGAGHYMGSILHARSPADLRDVLVRRYSAAWNELKNHAMPVATTCALVCAALGVRGRARLLAPVDSDPAWLAAFGGGLAAGIVGALSEDSGPVLFVVAIFTLGCLSTYLWGRPRSSCPPARAPTGRPAVAAAPAR